MSHTVTVKRISCMQVISFCFSIFSHPKICIAHIEIPHEKSFKWRGIYSNATIWFGTYLSEKHASVTCQRFKFQFISMLMVNVCDWMFHFRSPPPIRSVVKKFHCIRIVICFHFHATSEEMLSHSRSVTYPIEIVYEYKCVSQCKWVLMIFTLEFRF